MIEKPVNQIDIDSNIIKANDINSVINIKINDVNNNPVNLENEIEYFYMVRNNKYYPVTDISFNNGDISFKLPNLYKGLYKIEIKDKKGSIYPANDDISILLNQSFVSGKETEFISMKDSILKDVPEILNDYITENEEIFKGEDGKDGKDGKDGRNGLDGIDGKDGKDGRNGINGKDGIDGKDGIFDYDLISIKEDLNIYIPSDFNNIHNAIKEYKLKNIGLNTNINIIIESGHVISEGLYIKNGDLSMFNISSIDDTVVCNLNTDTDLFNGNNCVMPNILTSFDLNNTGANGYYLLKKSSGYIKNNCGFLNSGNNGVFISGGSIVDASGCIIKGSGNRNLWVSRASLFNGEFGNYSDCKGDISIYVSMSSNAHLMGAIVNDNFNNGLNSAAGSTVNIRDGKFINNPGKALICQKGGKLTAENIEVDNCTDALTVETASVGFFNRAIIKNVGNNALTVSGASNCHAYGSTFTNIINKVIVSTQSSFTNAQSINIYNNETQSTIDTHLGSNINLYGSKKDDLDLTVDDTTINEFNTTSLRGIIYK